MAKMFLFPVIYFYFLDMVFLDLGCDKWTPKFNLLLYILYRDGFNRVRTETPLKCIKK